MNPLILTSTPDTVPEVPGPRQDFVMLAAQLQGTILYPATTDGSLLARIEKRTAADIRQAFAALKYRSATSVYVSLSEKVGVPLSLLLPKDRRRRPGHLLVAHHLTSANKRGLQKQTNYLSRFDRIITLGSSQYAYLMEEAGYDRERITRIRHSVDTRFWTPDFDPVPPTKLENAPPESDYVLAVGRERRDYETFAAALRQLPNQLAIIVASSPWSRQTGQAPVAGEAPENMQFRRGLSYAELRNFYRNATMVIVPLEAGTTYAAGSTGCLEGMAMAKPVLATETPGLTDYQRNDAGEPLVAMVPPDATALASAIQSLKGDPKRRARLASTGRTFVERDANTDDYVAALVDAVQTTLGRNGSLAQPNSRR